MRNAIPPQEAEDGQDVKRFVSANPKLAKILKKKEKRNKRFNINNLDDASIEDEANAIGAEALKEDNMLAKLSAGVRKNGPSPTAHQSFENKKKTFKAAGNK